MGRDGCRVDGPELPAEAEDRVGPERNRRAQGHGGEGGQPDPAEAGLGDGHAALEADADEQIDGQPHVERLGEFQVALHQRGHEAEREEQDGGRKQVGADGVEAVHG